jgi:hypothetical protein
LSRSTPFWQFYFNDNEIAELERFFVPLAALTALCAANHFREDGHSQWLSGLIHRNHPTAMAKHALFTPPG